MATNNTATTNTSAENDSRYPCSILGGCTHDYLEGGAHSCPECEEKVHNLCHQHLRNVFDAPEGNRFTCGGDMCRHTMTGQQKTAVLSKAVQPVRRSVGSSPHDPPDAPQPCSAGRRCVAKSPRDSPSAAKCVHGQPRHFACARIPCPTHCRPPTYPIDSDTGVEESKGGEHVDLADTDSSSLSPVNSDITDRVAQSKGPTPRPTKRSSPRTRGGYSTPTTSASTPAVDQKKIDDMVKRSAKSLFAEDGFRDELLDRLIRKVADKKAENAIAAAISERSKEFVAGVKQDASRYTAEILAKSATSELKKSNTQRAKDLKSWQEGAKDLLRKVADMTDKENAAPATSKGKAKGFDVALGKLEDTMKAEINRVVISHLSTATAQLTEGFARSCNVMMAEISSDLRRVGLLERRMDELTGLASETKNLILVGKRRGVTEEDESTPPSKKISSRRRSPKQHDSTRKRDEEEEAELARGRMERKPANEDLMVKIASAMRGFAQNNLNGQGHGPQSSNGSTLGGAAFGVGQVGAGPYHHQGTGGPSVGMGMSSPGMGVLPRQMGLQGQSIRVPMHGMGGAAGGPNPGLGGGPNPFTQTFGPGQDGQANGQSQFMFRH